MKKLHAIALALIVACAIVSLLFLISAGVRLFKRFESANSLAGLGAEITTASGLKYTDLVVGTGDGASPGKTLTVHYTVWLEDGTKVDSTVDRNQPYEFRIGAGVVIKGLDEGLMTMKVGGKRSLIIPSDLAYGPFGSPPRVPAAATLVCEVELLKVKDYQGKASRDF